MIRNSQSGYGSISKFFHWTMSAIIITLLIVGAVMGDLNAPLRGTVYNLHKLFGLLILLLVCVRLTWTITNTKPSLPVKMAGWMKAASAISHKLLYLLMFAMPMSGWVMSSAAGEKYYPNLFGLKLGLPLGANKALASSANSAHEILAWTLFFLLCLHVSAALFHHFFLRDNILRRMLPGGRRVNSQQAGD